MVVNNYLVNYYIDWNDGNSSSGVLMLPVETLRELFDLLYEKVVMGSIVDPELYSPDMINEINIEIIKKPNGRLKSKTPE